MEEKLTEIKITVETTATVTKSIKVTDKQLYELEHFINPFSYLFREAYEEEGDDVSYDYNLVVTNKEGK